MPRESSATPPVLVPLPTAFWKKKPPLTSAGWRPAGRATENRNTRSVSTLCAYSRSSGPAWRPAMPDMPTARPIDRASTRLGTPVAGESISEMMPLAKCDTTANWPSESAKTPYGSLGRPGGSSKPVSSTSRWSSSHSGKPWPVLHASLRVAGSQSIQVIDGSPRTGTRRRSLPPPRSWVVTALAKLPMRTPASSIKKSASGQAKVSVASVSALQPAGTVRLLFHAATTCSTAARSTTWTVPES